MTNSWCGELLMIWNLDPILMICCFREPRSQIRQKWLQLHKWSSSHWDFFLSKSYLINPISDCIYHFPIDLKPIWYYICWYDGYCPYNWIASNQCRDTVTYMQWYIFPLQWHKCTVLFAVTNMRYSHCVNAYGNEGSRTVRRGTVRRRDSSP